MTDSSSTQDRDSLPSPDEIVQANLQETPDDDRQPAPSVDVANVAHQIGTSENGDVGPARHAALMIHMRRCAFAIIGFMQPVRSLPP
jgi:hypothetical protein